MPRQFFFLVLTALVLAGSALSQDPKKDGADPKKAPAFTIPAGAAKTKDGKPDPKAAQEKMFAAGDFIARLVALGEDGASLTVEVTYQLIVPDPDAGFALEERQQEFQLTNGEDMKVRVLNPPPDFDDKGRPRRYTAKELKDLKGPGNLPGFTSSLDQLKPGQYLRIILSRKKGSPSPFVSMVVILAEPME